MTDTDITLRAPALGDGKAVHDLIARNPPLDLNSTYSYFLLCGHFADTCIVGEVDGAVRCFLSAYRLAQNPERLFVWQVAVDPPLRGMGMAGKMLEAVLQRPGCSSVRFVETTVSPSNTASRRAFERFAARHHTDFLQEVFLTKGDFGEEDHEEEILFRIGPLKS